MDDDFLLAIQLQEQFNNEYETSLFSSNGFQDNIEDGFEQISKKRKVEVGDEGGYSDSDLVPYLKPSPRQERPLSIVDASWETLDPSPDVRSMFLEFNETFFWGKLCGVEVKWSPRMTLCAGVCSYEGRGGLCSIRLSEPLLKLRPRKDLVETLLHEMIHALLFVTQNNRDRDGHGPEFCKHMNRINDATGTKISIYHSFTDEVDVYRTHWWKCNGPCQTRKPYFGFVKRAMNRAPSSLDPWWEQHSRTCGGTYTKVKEPEGYGKKGKKEGKKEEKKEGKTLEKKAPANAKPSATSTASGLQDIRNMIPFSGKGFTLGGKSQSTTSTPSNTPFLPVIKSPPPSPKKLFPPSSPARNLGSPVLYGWDQNNKGMPSRTATSTGPKPPKKRSVGNTRAFVNINGSPVRIHKPRSSSQGNQDANNGKQRSIGDLFNRKDDLKKPLGQPSTTTSNTGSKTNVPNSDSRTSVSSPSTYGSWDNSTAVSTGTKGSPANPTPLSKYFTPTNGDSKTLGAASGSGSGQGSRKRPWDERDKSSGAIFDIFQRTITNDKEEKSPTGQRTSATASATITSLSSTAAVQPPTTAGLNATGIQDSFSTLSFSSSSSDLPVMVTCPACLTKVQESKINQHLDSCLNGF